MENTKNNFWRKFSTGTVLFEKKLEIKSLGHFKKVILGHVPKTLI